MFFNINESNMNIGQTPNTPVYIMGLKLGSTVGHRGRLRGFSWGLAEVAPMDVQMYGQLLVMDNTSDGTGSDVTADISKVDPHSRDSIVEKAIIQYSAPPTSVIRMMGSGAFNARGGFNAAYGNPDQCPIWGPGETLVIAISIGNDPSGNKDVVAACTMSWEEF